MAGSSPLGAWPLALLSLGSGIVMDRSTCMRMHTLRYHQRVQKKPSLYREKRERDDMLRINGTGMHPCAYMRRMSDIGTNDVDDRHATSTHYLLDML